MKVPEATIAVLQTTSMASPRARATQRPVATLPPPSSSPSPSPARVSTTPIPTVTQGPDQCPASWFCYPRLGIAGPITPYTDCAGSTDIGSGIRRFTCLPGYYLLGHAYTEFGRITNYQTGDVVVVFGQPFVITGSFEQSACSAPARPPAALSLQTSLTLTACGTVLVVVGR